MTDSIQARRDWEEGEGYYPHAASLRTLYVRLYSACVIEARYFWHILIGGKNQLKCMAFCWWKRKGIGVSQRPLQWWKWATATADSCLKSLTLFTEWVLTKKMCVRVCTCSFENLSRDHVLNLNFDLIKIKPAVKHLRCPWTFCVSN